MGGAETEIRSASRNILLEAAWFDPISIRRTSKALGLRTEASMRFERGADPGNGGTGFTTLRGADSASWAAARCWRARWTFIQGARKPPRSS